MGNLLPAIFALPPMAYGVWRLYVASQILGPGLVWIGAGVVAGWLAMNFLGLYQNGRMRRDMLRDYRSERGEDGLDKLFVGMARPTYSSIVDPHEDVGFLILHGDRLEYWGEDLKVSLGRSQIKDVRFRPNAHSLVGLGGWISIEGISDGKPVRLLIEPREKSTLLGNIAFSRQLRKKLERWRSAQ